MHLANKNDKHDKHTGKRNTARFFTENRHIAWVLLAGTVLAGVFGYLRMPKRKDPDIPVRVAAALVSWPGATASELEEQVVKSIEESAAENSHVDRIESTVRAGVAVTTIRVDDKVAETGEQFDEIWLRLATVRLPEGAHLKFIKDFGDTAALMLTVASPMASPVELQLRAGAVAETLARARGGDGERVSVLLAFPFGLEAGPVRRHMDQLASALAAHGATGVKVVAGHGFVAIDAGGIDEAGARAFLAARPPTSELHPDVWTAAVIGDLAGVEARLTEVAGPRYTYAELEDMTESLRVALHGVDEVAKVTRSGLQQEEIVLEYSQEQLAAYGIQASRIPQLIGARNLRGAASTLEAGGRNVIVSPSGELRAEDELGGIAIGASADGAPLYLRDVVEISRGYKNPPEYLNDYTYRDAGGKWQRTRAVTLAVTMRAGEQIAAFGAEVDRALAGAVALLPDDLVISRTSDQPQQVTEKLDLFMNSLIEAILLVVVVALLGFWEWRSALLMALSIPITLFMTFAMMMVLGIDVQQVSIASLIIALGLLVDVPVVAGDAMKRGLAEGLKPLMAAWLGPTRLAKAILFATITNIVAYLPFLSLPGDTGRFVYSLPIVLTCSLVAAFVVSMTFIPLLGYYILRPPRVRRAAGSGRFARGYRSFVGWAIDHRWIVLGAAASLLLAGGAAVSRIKVAFFPKDLSYLAYIDVWLPEDAAIAQTRAAARQVDEIVRETAEELGHGRKILHSVTTFVGGGGPRFWFSVAPEQRQVSYAQLVIQLEDSHDTGRFVGPLQAALTRRMAGALVDVQQLESGPAVGAPVAIRLAGEDRETLRRLARQLDGMMRALPSAERVRDSWGSDQLVAGIDIDADRAGAAGVTHDDVAMAVKGAVHGVGVGTLREGDLDIPIVARLRAGERTSASDLENLYVGSRTMTSRVPLAQIARLGTTTTAAKIYRRDQRRTITVSAFPVAGKLPSEVMAELRPQLTAFAAKLPPGFSLQIGGEEDDQKKSFGDMAVVLVISVAAIFLALVIQFKNAVKPLIVFSAIPFGAVGALAGLRAMGAPFGFMAFLGLISLIGVIVSHVIVLFDFIEERHEEGAPLRDALIDAGLARLRPVLITVAATVLGLFPLAMHGGPLWQPLCFVQIAGLSVATVVTLLLVPVLYATFVLDLKVVRWTKVAHEDESDPETTVPAIQAAAA